MTKRKTAMFAVFSAALCLILCGSMLLNGTFAWFTDSVANNENIIASGILDVEMSYSDSLNGTYTDASEGTIFDYQLWEPGYTDVKYVKIENKGNLALKYNLQLTTDEVATADGVKLSDVIEVYMGVNTEMTSRSDLTKLTYVGTLAELMADGDGAAYGIMLPLSGATDVDLNPVHAAIAVTGSQTYCIALHMKEEAGNEYQNLSIGSGIAVQLYATQYTWENDSFDNSYDGETNYTGLYANVTQIPTTGIEVPEYDLSSLVSTGYTRKLDVAYKFEATDTVEQAQESPYQYWHADFVISFDKPVAKGSAGLGGQYTFWSQDWLGFTSPIDIEAGQELRLLKDSKGIFINYEELCRDVKVFNCGAYNLDNANIGTTMTVELRLYETTGDPNTDSGSKNEETGKFVTIGSYDYTFGPAGLPSATVTNLDVPKQEMTIAVDITDGNFTDDLETRLVKPDAAFNFTAQDDASTIKASAYKDWYVDYFVSVNEEITTGVTLVGAYGSYESGAWFGFDVPAGDYTEPVPLLGYMTGGVSNWTYADIVTGVESFNCGVVNENDANNGKIMTVELRIINPDDTSETYVISSTTHTFQ